MKHKRATDYGGRTPRGFWIESAFIALIASALKGKPSSVQFCTADKLSIRY